jgi:hypothetical protein
MLTDEMVDIFKRCMDILAAGAQERWEDDKPPGRKRELLALERRLNVTLLRRPMHAISVLEDELDGEMPDYGDRASGGKCWQESAELRRALLEASGMKAADAPPRYRFSEEEC